jgi:ABC-type transport system involved in multi-copper enzyme maturation permease subunit
LATDLSNREIVLGKLLVCLGNMTLLVLTGLPVLSLMQLVGGVDPNLVLAGYAVTGMSMLSLAAVSMLISVYSQKARDAIVLSYLALVAYLMVSLLLQVPIRAIRGPAVAPPPLVMWSPSGPIRMTPPPAPALSLDQEIAAGTMEAFSSGNLLIMLSKLKDAWDSSVPLATVLPDLVRSYALFHGLLALVCTTWAVWRLRKAALHARPRKIARRERTAYHWLRPHLGRRPMLWKELFAERGMTFNIFGKAIVGVIIFVSFAPPLWIVGSHLWHFYHPPSGWGGWRGLWDDLPNEINCWVRLVGTTVACLTLLGVAIRAAGSVSGERDRQTFDSLLCTPLEAKAILSAKWLGSILSVRWAWVWLSLVWGVGVVMGGLSIVTLPWLLLIWLVYAAFSASLGLRLSITSQSTLRATLVTLAALGLLTLGHWLPRLFVPFSTNPGIVWWLAENTQAFGLTPPLALAWFAFRSEDIGAQAFLGNGSGPNPWDVLVGIIGGLVVWGAGAAWLWARSQHWFLQQLGRQDEKAALRGQGIGTHVVVDSWGP